MGGGRRCTCLEGVCMPRARACCRDGGRARAAATPALMRAQNVLNHMLFGLRKADGFLCMAEELNCLVFQEVPRPCNVVSLSDKGHAVLHYAGDKKPYARRV